MSCSQSMLETEVRSHSFVQHTLSIYYAPDPVGDICVRDEEIQTRYLDLAHEKFTVLGGETTKETDKDCVIWFVSSLGPGACVECKRKQISLFLWGMPCVALTNSCNLLTHLRESSQTGSYYPCLRSSLQHQEKKSGTERLNHVLFQ